MTACISCQSAYAQKQVDTQHLVWTRYSLKAALNERYHLRQEIENRVYWPTWQQHQFVVRTFAERKLSEGWGSGLGFTYFRQTLPHAPDAENYTVRTELRPQLEVSYSQRLREKLSLHHRYWTEFRFFEQAGGGFAYGHNRTRYKLEVRYAVSGRTTLLAFDEIHLNIGRQVALNIFDQNRYGASVKYQASPALGAELGYLNWYQQRASGTDFYNRHILRATLHHFINLKKATSP
ncbi:DUF2490 domain-containing protein [Roseivirga sp. BDSF3-8]|uniref:DUF2490 domain-containing protein n=1 Tax=Roseivirga sp. BDSF3-8 TaxID=3241598 RepID=UPI0035326407